MKKIGSVIIAILLMCVSLCSCAGGLKPEGDYSDMNGNYYTFSDAQSIDGAVHTIFYTENDTLIKSGRYWMNENNVITAIWKDGTTEIIGTYVQKTKSINIDGQIVYQHHGL